MRFGVHGSCQKVLFKYNGLGRSARKRRTGYSIPGRVGIQKLTVDFKGGAEGRVKGYLYRRGGS